MDKKDKIYVAGHRGMVGAAIVRKLLAEGYENLILQTRRELDLQNQAAVSEFFDREKTDIVILAAARVGGINDNMLHKAEFLLENLKIQCNVIEHAYRTGVKKFCFMGSSCIYPRDCPQPIKEESLLTGPLEPTNEGYALAKICGYKQCLYLSQQYDFNTISVMPCNLYGTNDHFDLEKSHVLSALVRRFCDAVDDGLDSVTVWGSGRPRREFLHVDDMASAVFFLMNNYDDPEFINVGSGADVSIRELAEKVADAAGFTGEIVWDTSKPDGMMLKCMDVSALNKQGWQPEVSLDAGIAKTVSEYRELKKHGKVNR
jgi:GDP-L-fucose synthase